MAGQHTLTWRIIASGGLETAWVTVDGGRLHGRGRAVGLDPEPYWASYELETGEEYVTRRLAVEVEAAGWRRSLELLRDPDGTWRANGEAVAAVAGALDCDLGRCPLTNTMPVLRDRLHQQPGNRDYLMAWVAVPDLAVLPSEQTYTYLRPRTQGGAHLRYQGRHRGFVGEITVDADGLVIDYPALATRLAPAMPTPAP